MSTATDILIVAGCSLIALWLVLAVCFGIGMFDQRSSINASETTARMFGRTSRPLGRRQWLLICITAIPLLLFGVALVIVQFFSSLLVQGWCRLTGRPVLQPRSLQDLDDDNLS